MNVCIFDTETTSINKPFCYNIGYVIVDTKNGITLIERDFVIEQIWHNLPLFNTAYYSSKRPLYVSAMRRHKTLMRKFGAVTQQMIRDFKKFNIQSAYAFNSDFDENTFNFCCDWFKCINPFENIPVYDILAYATNFLGDYNYQKFCEENKLFTENGNYSSTAEAFTKYLLDDVTFVEDHTALSDSRIEKDILLACLAKGAQLNERYPKRYLKREAERDFTVLYKGEVVLQQTACRSFYKKATNTLYLN